MQPIIVLRALQAVVVMVHVFSSALLKDQLLLLPLLMSLFVLAFRL